MRQRQDFYTLCPGCETKVKLTLAAKLQAAEPDAVVFASPASTSGSAFKSGFIGSSRLTIRGRSSLRMSILPYRLSPASPRRAAFFSHRRQLLPHPASAPANIPATATHRSTGLINSWHHLPAIPPNSRAADCTTCSRSHAWSWERKTEQQSTPPQNHQSGFGR